MSFPRYPRYKDSGVEWLGEVPEDWEIAPMKLLATLKGRLGWQNLRADEYTEEGPYLVTSEHLVQDRIAWDRCYHVTNERYAMAPEIQLRADDLLMMKDGAAMGKLGYVDELPGEACLNSHLLLFRPRDRRVTNRFLYYVLGSPAFAVYMGRERTGSTFFGISQQSIGNFSLAVPPAGVVNDIVRFLDRETAKIDALIAEQQRLIELLKEKRQAVISHAVTRGLNPDAPMKPSGIEWLGDVPAHWEVRRLKHISPQITVGIVVEPSKYYVEAGVPALRSLNVRPGAISQENMVYISPEANDSLNKSRLRAGDLVAVRSGQPGTTAVVPDELDGCNCIDLIIIRKPHSGSQWFLSWFLGSNAALHQFDTGSGGAIQQHFNIGTAMDLLAPTPPIAEQEAIAEYLRDRSGRLDALTAEAERTITLLQERRTALISAAVTGKIDVRGLADRAA